MNDLGVGLDSRVATVLLCSKREGSRYAADYSEGQKSCPDMSKPNGVFFLENIYEGQQMKTV